MAINFNLLRPNQNIQSGPVGQGGGGAPISGGDEGGLDDIMGGLSKLVGAFKGQEAAPPNMGGGNGAMANPAMVAPNANLSASNALTPNGQPNIFKSPITNGGSPPSPMQQQSPNQNMENNSIFGNAQKMLGQREGNPVLTDYLRKANPNLDPSITPWCAGFVGSVLNASGQKGTGSLAARSYLNYGQATDKPSMGDIVVMSRGNNPAQGHVGFYAGTDKNGNVLVLGGNQDNSVSIKPFASTSVLGFRRPPSGQEVQGFAKQNGLRSPQDITQLPNVINQQQSQQQGQQPMTTGLDLASVAKAAQNTFPDNPNMAKLAFTQAVLESNLLKSPSGLAKKNNLFGIKGHGTGGTADMMTTEFVNGKKVRVPQGFAVNNSLEDSFNQYKELMAKDRYKGVGAAGSFEDAAAAVHKAGYATDPKYTAKLIDLYNNNLAQYFNQQPMLAGK